MPETKDQIHPGHCPVRLSTGQPILDFVPREYVATGRTVSSSDPAPSPPSASRPVERINSPTGPARSSINVAQDLLRHTLQLATAPAESLTPEDRLVLSSGAAMFAAIQELIEAQLRGQTSEEATAPPPPPPPEPPQAEPARAPRTRAQRQNR